MTSREGSNEVPADARAQMAQPARGVCLSSQLPSVRPVLGLAWLFSLLLLAILTLLLLGRFREVRSAPGVLAWQPGPQRVVAPLPARIASLSVAAGEWVEAGQLLAQLDANRFSRNGESDREQDRHYLLAQEALTDREMAVHARLVSEQQRRFREQRRRQSALETSGLEELQLLAAQLRLAEQALDALQQLGGARAVARLEVDRQSERVLELRRQHGRLQAEVTRAGLELAALAAEHDRSLQALTQDRLRLERRQSELHYQRQVARRTGETTLVAPEAGQVMAVTLGAGEFVRAGQVLVVIRPRASRLHVEAYVPSRIASRLHAGQAAMLRLDAYDYRQFGRIPALVTEIGEASLDPREFLLPVPNLAEPVMRVRLEPVEQIPPAAGGPRLSPGQSLSVDFILRERRLIAYILSPVLELRGRLL